jgi:transcriptional regulator with XRE-family HTH domain
MPRPSTVPPRSLQHAALGGAIKLVIAEDPRMTQETVAADSGLKAEQVGRFSRGQGNPTFGTLLKLCEGLHVSLSGLMLRAEELHERRCGR